jgi:membrane associated rhomboid family serine protease
LNNPQRLPLATLLFIAANLGAAFMLLWQPELITEYGFDPASPSVRSAISALFLHQNLLHLLGNMLFLAAVGPAVELAAGSLRFVTVYLLGGFAGVATHWAFTQKIAPAPHLIGASGCISACIAYYALRYHHMKVALAPKISVPVFAMVGVWLLLQIGGAFVSLGSVESGTAYWAHVGGFAMGLVLSIIFGAPQHAHRERAHEAIDQMDSRSPAAKLAAAELVLKTHPHDVKALRDKADALSLQNDSDEEAACLVLLLELLQEAEQKDILIRLNKINRLEVLPSLRRTFLADKYKKSEPDLSRLLLLSVIRVMSDGQRPDALYALACLDDQEYPENASTWLRDLFTNYPLHPASDLARARGWKP